MLYKLGGSLKLDGKLYETKTVSDEKEHKIAKKIGFKLSALDCLKPVEKKDKKKPKEVEKEVEKVDVLDANDGFYEERSDVKEDVLD